MSGKPRKTPVVPRAAGEGPLTPSQRADPEVARQVIESLYSDPSVRHDCLQLLADCITYAHDLNPESWSLTLFRDAVNVNVGWQRAMYLRRNMICSILDGGRLTEQDRARLSEVGTLGWITDSCEGVDISAGRLKEVIDVVQPSMLSFMNHAARQSEHVAYFGAHSPGVIEHLRDEGFSEVPHSEHRALHNANASQGYWKISPGRGGSEWQQFLSRSVIAIGTDDSESIAKLQPRSRQDLRSKLEETAWGNTGNTGYSARQFWQLYDEMKIGDLICAYARGQVLGWGEVTGNYEFVEDDFSYQHRRQVRWHSTEPVSVNALSESLRRKLFRNETMFALTQHEFAEITGETRMTTASGVSTGGLAVARQVLSSLGFHFSAWQLATFTNALQTKGFVILSGISGTGKTKLVQQFAAMLPDPERTRVSTAQADEIVITVQPYMLKYGRFVVPARLFDRYALPDAVELAEPEFEIGGITHRCRMYQHHRGEAVVSIALLRGQVRQQFLSQFVLGDRFVLDPIVTADQNLTGFRIVPESEWVDTETDADDVFSESNHLFLSVRPDWRDSKALLGYYNPLTQTYEWTPFLRFLERAARSYEQRDGLAWFVVLDEMNLAHVEYYFADLLSVMESGRDEEGWTREALVLVYPDAAEGDLPKREMRLPPNLYVVGTVNIDETTHAFSPKVLDRAFSIELVDVDFSDYPPSVSGDLPELTDVERQALLASFTRNGRFPRIDKSEIAAYVAEHQEVRDRLQALNSRLRQDNLHFGYRVFDEIVTFLVIAEENGMFDGMEENAAFDAAVLMKVLPKFHGSRGKLQRPSEAVLDWCADPDRPTMVASAAETGPPALPVTGYALPKTAERVQRMLAELQTDGFTAFG